jgi:hypothetical protein
MESLVILRRLGSLFLQMGKPEIRPIEYNKYN